MLIYQKYQKDILGRVSGERGGRRVSGFTGGRTKGDGSTGGWRKERKGRKEGFGRRSEGAAEVEVGWRLVGEGWR